MESWPNYCTQNEANETIYRYRICRKKEANAAMNENSPIHRLYSIGTPFVSMAILIWLKYCLKIHRLYLCTLLIDTPFVHLLFIPREGDLTGDNQRKGERRGKALAALQVQHFRQSESTHLPNNILAWLFLQTHTFDERRGYTHALKTCTTTFWAICSPFWYVSSPITATLSAINVCMLLIIKVSQMNDSLCLILCTILASWKHERNSILQIGQITYERVQLPSMPIQR